MGSCIVVVVVGPSSKLRATYFVFGWLTNVKAKRREQLLFIINYLCKNHIIQWTEEK